MSTVKSVFPVLNLGCAACAAKVENAVSAAKGVKNVSVNLTSSNMSVEFDPDVISPLQIQQTVRNAGYDMIMQQNIDPDSISRIQKKN